MGLPKFKLYHVYKTGTRLAADSRYTDLADPKLADAIVFLRSRFIIYFSLAFALTSKIHMTAIQYNKL